jgi:hypothetical protein
MSSRIYFDVHTFGLLEPESSPRLVSKPASRDERQLTKLNRAKLRRLSTDEGIPHHGVQIFESVVHSEIWDSREFRLRSRFRRFLRHEDISFTPARLSATQQHLLRQRFLAGLLGQPAGVHLFLHFLRCSSGLPCGRPNRKAPPGSEKPYFLPCLRWSSAAPAVVGACRLNLIQCFKGVSHQATSHQRPDPRRIPQRFSSLQPTDFSLRQTSQVEHTCPSGTFAGMRVATWTMDGRTPVK